MSRETQAVDAIMAAIEVEVSPDAASSQEAANILAEVGSQIEAQLDALKETEGIEPE